MKPKRQLAAAVLAILFAASAGAASAGPAQIAGTWVGKTEVPGVGPDQITLVLKESNGTVTGTISDEGGSVAPDTEITDVKWAGNQLTYSFLLPDGGKIMVTSHLEDGKLPGTWAHEQGGATGSFVMEKKKE